MIPSEVRWLHFAVVIRIGRARDVPKLAAKKHHMYEHADQQQPAIESTPVPVTNPELEGHCLCLPRQATGRARRQQMISQQPAAACAETICSD
jgi:hypothetical protein